MLARVPAGGLIDRMRHEPKLRAAEVLHSDTTWRPCTVLAWAKHRAGWAVLIRWPDGQSDWRTHRCAARADLDGDDGRIARALVAQQLADAWQKMLVDPFHRKTIGRKKLERAGAFQHLQRPHPGIELLLRELGLQRTFASSPKRGFHARCLRDRFDGERGCGVYTLERQR